MFRRARSRSAALAITLGLSATARADVYLSLGDSIAFGETVFIEPAALGGVLPTPRSATAAMPECSTTYLGQQAGGTNPSLINLGVDGETLSSFFTGTGRVPPQAGITDAQLAQFNLNYTGATPPTQDAPVCCRRSAPRARTSTTSPSRSARTTSSAWR